MYRVLSCSKDTYITNRIVENSFRAIDANTGLAGTIDLFKLAGETNVSVADGPFISGTTEPIELSRALVKFDISSLQSLTSSILDVSSPSFHCTMQLFDVIGGQTLPSNFTLVVHPLAQQFDEGVGRDVISYEDLDAANYVTASFSGGTTSVWFVTGADAQGAVGQPSIDIITGSMALGSLVAQQTFVEGDEDLSIDVTSIVSATLTGQIPDYGFRLAFTGSQEQDGRTRFVKRFASRHSTDTRMRPRLLVGFDDSVRDNHKNFYFDVSGSLFLNSFQRGYPANIVSGSSLTPIVGPNCLLVTITSGTYSSSFLGSQAIVGSNQLAGVYSASFAIPSNDPLLRSEIINASSATFTEVWGSIDGTVGYHTGTLVINAIQSTTFKNVPEQLTMNVTNVHAVYLSSERARFRVFSQDSGFSVIASKFPIEAQSIVFDRMFYRVRDDNSNEIVIPFDTAKNATRLSTDSDGMYFDLYMSDLDVGRVYAIDLLLDDHGIQQVFERCGGRFRVNP